MQFCQLTDLTANSSLEGNRNASIDVVVERIITPSENALSFEVFLQRGLLRSFPLVQQGFQLLVIARSRLTAAPESMILQGITIHDNSELLPSKCPRS